jgi:hypothetical protein
LQLWNVSTITGKRKVQNGRQVGKRRTNNMLLNITNWYVSDNHYNWIIMEYQECRMILEYEDSKMHFYPYANLEEDMDSWTHNKKRCIEFKGLTLSAIAEYLKLVPKLWPHP